MFILNFALNWRGGLQKLLKHCKYLLESRQCEEHKFLSGFPSSEAVWPLLKMLYTWNIYRLAKQVKTQNGWRKFCSKTDEWHSMKLLTFLVFHLCQSLLKFCFKLERRGTEISETLKVPSGEQTVWRTQVFEWFSKFRSSMTSARDAVHLEHISTSITGENAEQVKEVLLKNRWITLHEVAYIFGISFVSVTSENIGRQSVCASSCHQICALPAEWEAEGELWHYTAGPSGETLKRLRTCCKDNRSWYNSSWRYREGDFMISDRFKRSHRICLPCFKQHTVWNALNVGVIADLLYAVPRRLLCRGQHWLERKRCYREVKRSRNRWIAP
jgi:hypothetical protein